MASERQLIARVHRKLPSRGTGLRVGIGDDAAVIRSAGSNDWVVTTDSFLENVHFRLGTHPPAVVGFKALARATSDLAAMGALPSYFLMSLALPDKCTGKWFDLFLDGMSQASRKFGLVLVGGDTTRDAVVSINLTVIGEVSPGRAVLRSGARPGDLICVSGVLGEAELGLQLLLKGWRQKKWRKRIEKHFYPEPRLALGRWLAKRGRATAMIDTSDGLSTDLANICDASGVGARLWSEKLPKVSLPMELQSVGLDPVRLALHGGEDYELLVTGPPRWAQGLPGKFSGVPLTIIGEITHKKKIVVMDAEGRSFKLQRCGWDPFRKDPTRKQK